MARIVCLTTLCIVLGPKHPKKNGIPPWKRSVTLYMNNTCMHFIDDAMHRWGQTQG